MEIPRNRDPFWLRHALAEVTERPARAAGPGGQHVNKTSTAIELRFDLAACDAVPEDVAERLRVIAGSRLTQDDVIVLFAQEHRSQEMNRHAARERLADMLRRAAVRPKVRRPTKPTRAAREERLQTKTRRSGVKRGRGRVSDFD